MELFFFLNTNLLEDPSDFMIFVGRFHPLVVHLPIGFLLLAAVAQFATRWPKFHPLKPFLMYLWGLGAIGAALAVVFGYLLSLSGDYNEDTLFWHKWSGIAVLAFALLCYFISKKHSENTKPIQWLLVALVTGTMIYTGHLGGNLTHGSTYLLEYAPNTVRSIAGLQVKTEPRPKVTILDSADVYLDLIAPMMDSKCVSCHNTGKKKGDLLLTSYSNMIKGGENGVVITPGDMETSELFRRITLPKDHDDFMPSEGKRSLTSQEVDIIEWWIATGAPSAGFITELDSENEVKEAVNSYLGLDKNTILSKQVPPANQASIDSLVQQGFIINRLMNNNYFLEANYSLSEKPFTAAHAKLLTDIKEQLLWLDVSNAKVTDESLKQIGRLENLIKLDLSGNVISDTGIQFLEKLINLESLNLYNTSVSEGLVDLAPKLTHLQKIYLWQTEINDSIMRRIQSENKNLEVISNRKEEIEYDLP